MSSNALAELRRETGLDASVLNGLTEDEAYDLLGLLRSARARQERQLDDAVTQALDHFPRMIKVAARKILFR